MSRLPHQRRAAVALDPRLQIAGGLHVVDHRCAGVAGEHVGGEQHQLPIGVDDRSVAGDDAETVAIAVEREPELVVGSREAADQILKILRLRRIGVMIGEVPVDVAEKFRHRATQPAEKFGRVGAGDAVAAVDRDLHPSRDPQVSDDAVQVRSCDVRAARVAAGAVAEIACLDPRLDRLDLVAGERVPGDDHFESVVVRRIVAAGNHDAALRI